LTTVFHLHAELVDQPQCWRRAANLAASFTGVLPRQGERVAVVGCGTSWFMAQAYARLREDLGLGETDAVATSEFPRHRRYDRVLAITRSGTTTEVVDLLTALKGHIPTTVVTADPNTPVVPAADERVVLDFADEKSVVQTRFATTALTLLRTSLGQDVAASIEDAEAVLAGAVPDLVGCEQYTFLGTGWTIGLANEAALKMRETTLSWTESYPAMEYRHGPISISTAGRVVWFFCEPPGGLADEVRATGASVILPTSDPLAELVRLHRVAEAVADAKGLNPDEPRHLTRSIVLENTAS
jgi:CRISPR-associated protein Cas5a/b/c